MSYINDALKKAQKEKDSLYKYYHTIIWAKSGGRKSGASRRKIFIIAGVIVLAVVLAGYAGYKLLAGPPKKVAAPVAERREMERDRAATASRRPADGARRKATTEDVGKLYEEALAAQRARDMKRAEDAYRGIIRVDPRHVQTLNNLGVIYMGRKEYGRAAMMFQRALRVDDKYVDPHYNLACLYAQSGDTAKALDNLKRAFDLNPAVRSWADGDKDLEPIRRAAGYNQIFGKK